MHKLIWESITRASQLPIWFQTLSKHGWLAHQCCTATPTAHHTEHQRGEKALNEVSSAQRTAATWAPVNPQQLHLQPSQEGWPEALLSLGREASSSPTASINWQVNSHAPVTAHFIKRSLTLSGLDIKHSRNLGFNKNSWEDSGR